MLSLNPHITLVGAGPGDPDLITVAGFKSLQQAQVILYDALIDPNLLNHAPQAEKIFVGKRKGFKRFTQAEINKLLVSKALERGNVVRLKGGDPFIFGRGSEEIEYATNHGIRTSVIPGISSATSAPLSQSIPLTRRGVSRGFTVLTATTKDEQLSDDLQHAITGNITVVILMGMHKLKQIVAMYNEHEKSHLPISIVQWAYNHKEKVVTGRIHNILQLVEEHFISNPAVIIIGHVVSFGEAGREKNYTNLNMKHE